MNFPNVTFQRTVTANISLTPQQWELYDLPGAQEAVPVLNKQLELSIANAKSATEALENFWPTLKLFDDLGACDTEPRWVARKICEQAFGEEC